jgi:hypothetical protein
MPMKVEEIKTEALKLTPRSRAHLAEQLLHSLETLSDEENEALWIEEAQRRNEEFDEEESGRPAEDVFRNARTQLT